jgi:hypothetical protein
MSSFPKRIWWFLAGAVTIVVIALGISYAVLYYYEPDIYDVEPDPVALGYYHENYEQCRQAFLDEALYLKEHFDSVWVFSSAIESRTDTGLYIDYCYIPARKDPTHLLILSSGIHGIEGFAGSAVQFMFMEEYLDTALARDMGVLFIHGLNPYGFRHTRRFTENNVDLNRNWDIDKSLFATPNPGYFRFNDMINPRRKVNLNSPGNRFFLLKAALKMATNNIEFARQSILQGQYEYQEGLYFGGTDFEPQVPIIRSLLEKVCTPYEIIFHIDLHTGYGGWGKLHFFPNPVKDKIARSTLDGLFSQYDIDWGDEESFYTITGGFPTFVGKVNPGKLFLPMTFEYGTMDSQTTIGAIKSLQVIINENQGHHHGYRSKRDSTITTYQFANMYYPQSDGWKTQVIVSTREAFDNLLPRYIALGAPRYAN